MARNVGNFDRVARSIAVLPLIACSVLTPLPLVTRILAFALPAVYMLFTALKGTCLGYRLMGKSTCPVNEGPRVR
jgi:hypothetical protein